MAPGIGPDAAGERGAADDRRGDDVELVLDAEARDRGVEAGRRIAALTATRMPISDERRHDGPAGVDAAELGGLRVAADREHVAAEPATGRDERHDERRRR